MAILEELKAKANGKADQANNIQEAVSMMEFGGGSSGESVMVINNTNGTLDKTWQEIYDAMSQGKLCVVKEEYDELTRTAIPTRGIEIAIVTFVVAATEERYVVAAGQTNWVASSATGYPASDNTVA